MDESLWVCVFVVIKSILKIMHEFGTGFTRIERPYSIPVVNLALHYSPRLEPPQAATALTSLSDLYFFVGNDSHIVGVFI